MMHGQLKNVNKINTNNGLTLIASETYFEALINCYKHVKHLIYNQVKACFNNEAEIPTLDYPQCLQEK